MASMPRSRVGFFLQVRGRTQRTGLFTTSPPFITKSID